MSSVGKAWRIVGLFLTAALYYLALSSDMLMMAVYGFSGVAVFFGSWSVAAWIDLHQDDER